MFTMNRVYTHAQKEISKYIIKYSKESFLLNKYFGSFGFYNCLKQKGQQNWQFCPQCDKLNSVEA